MARLSLVELVQLVAREIEPQDEAGAAASGEIVGRDGPRTRAVLQVGRRVGPVHLRRVRCDDERVRRQAGVREYGARGTVSEVHRRLVVRRGTNAPQPTMPAAPAVSRKPGTLSPPAGTCG